MTDAFEPLADRLWRYLPLVYRHRDGVGDEPERKPGDPVPPDAPRGDLRAYLEAFGTLLDAFRSTLDQRLADCFPDTPADGSRPAQEWLLPYFAELLGTELLAPHAAGRRAELAEAIDLAQRRGTRSAIERVVEAIAQCDAVVLEGFRIVARTAIPGAPLVPAVALGEAAEPPAAPPPLAARHPGLPLGTVDLRRHARAIRSDPANPAAVAVDFSGRRRVWPPDENRDPRPRDDTLYWRIANRRGAPCFPGAYDDPAARLVDFRDPAPRRGWPHPGRVAIHVPPPDGFFPPDARVETWAAAEPLLPWTENGVLAIGDDVTLAADEAHAFDHLRFDGTLRVTAGRLTLRRCAVRHLVIEPADAGDLPALEARDCLFESVEVIAGTARLEFVTVLGDAHFHRVQASEAILAGAVALDAPADTDCLRFSRTPEGLAGTACFHATSLAPEFIEARWGRRGCGVLADTCPAAIAEGAEDGTEMGAYHAWRFAAERTAIERKLKGMLPIGLRPVLVRDARLACTPPRAA